MSVCMKYHMISPQLKLLEYPRNTTTLLPALVIFPIAVLKIS